MIRKKVDRFDRFTQRARHVLSLAQKEAERLGHEYIATEHLLILLAAEGEGAAALVLRDAGVDLGKVRAAVEMLVGRGNADPRERSHIGLTPRAERGRVRRGRR
jgi:ATP-dependent Clp protease ATP-binding subunit ClpC